jgi:hypothetical protein
MVQVTKNDAKTGGYHLTLMTGLNDNDNLDLNWLWGELSINAK